jgi:hypothetical protein
MHKGEKFCSHPLQRSLQVKTVFSFSRVNFFFSDSLSNLDHFLHVFQRPQNSEERDFWVLSLWLSLMLGGGNMSQSQYSKLPQWWKWFFSFPFTCSKDLSSLFLDNTVSDQLMMVLGRPLLSSPNSHLDLFVHTYIIIPKYFRVIITCICASP